MLIGLTYLMTSVTVGLLLFLAAREHHRSRNGTDTFRYPKALLNALAFLTPVYGVLAAFIYLRDPQVPKGPGFLFALVVIFGAFIVGNTLAYFYFRAFAIQITGTDIVLTTWKGTRSIPFGDIRTMLIARGRPGVADLTLLDGQNRRLLKAGSSIEGLDDLIFLIKDNTRDLQVREKGGSGQWTK